MLALDDRTGNILTTIAIFAAVVFFAYAAKTTLAVFALGLLLAYMLEPMVTRVQQLLSRRSSSRTTAIAVVYLVGLVAAAGVAYTLAPPLVSQLHRLNEAVPAMVARLTDNRFLADHGSQIATIGERVAGAVTAAAAGVGWLLIAPIFAVFFLGNRARYIDAVIDLLAQRLDRASVRKTIGRVDTMLAQYVRAQAMLVGLSSLFYTASMALMGFPYSIALGILAGVLELIPVIGWMLGAAMVLTTGWLAGAPWLWMAGLIAVWKSVESFVISPRIMGHELELEPVTVIFALMAGGQIGGLLGVILSVPAVAVLHILRSERGSPQNATVA
jgi:predicted PurR-regulated permease PerM